MLGETISHYRVEERIGVGGMGEVFRAYDTQLERPVAIKRLHPDLTSDPDYRHRFLREARHAAQITHQCVAGVHDVIEKNGELFLVMEYVEGHTLSKAVLDRSDLAAVLKIMTKCAEAMVAAHEIGLIHRDLKPANIMLTHGGEVKILDFGLARRHTTDLEDLSESETAEIITAGKLQGTLAYMAPEVLRGRPADHRSDLFSLGVVFYQILTGEYPFGSGTQANLICNILSTSPVPIVRLNSVVPLELEECVLRLLEKDPELRYASAEDLLAHLKKIERDLSFPHLHMMPVPEEVRWLRRHRYSVGVIGLLALALIVFILIEWVLPPPLPKSPVIAVMPFESGSADDQAVAFAAGLAEMVNQRLNALSLERPFTVTPACLIRRDRLDTPQKTEEIGANLVLTGRVEARNGNVNVRLALLSAADGRELRRTEVQTPLSQPADLEYQILERTLAFLETGRGPPDRHLVKSYPNSQAAYDYFLRGLGHSLSPHSALAKDNFERALQMEPHFALAEAYLGLATLRDADTEPGIRLAEATRLCQEARDLDSRLQIADFCLGEAASAKGNLQEAVDAYEAAVQEGPLDYEMLEGLEAASDRLRRPEIAVSVLEAAIDRQPDSWLGYAYLAYVQYKQDNYESAAANEKKVAELAPKRYQAYTYLAVFYDLLGCPEQRAESYQAALALKRDASIYTNLATTRFYSGHYPEALQAAQEAKIYQERDPVLSYVESGNLGDIYYWAPRGNQETAAAFYKEALHLVNEHMASEPDEEEDLRSKCWYLAMLGQWDSARECLATLLKFPDLNGSSCYKVALIYQRLGDADNALDYLERSLKKGQQVAKVRNEPIFRENPGVQALLSSYVEEPKACP